MHSSYIFIFYIMAALISSSGQLLSPRRAVWKLAPSAKRASPRRDLHLNWASSKSARPSNEEPSPMSLSMETRSSLSILARISLAATTSRSLRAGRCTNRQKEGSQDQGRDRSHGAQVSRTASILICKKAFDVPSQPRSMGSRRREGLFCFFLPSELFED